LMKLMQLVENVKVIEFYFNYFKVSLAVMMKETVL
jgi:hypothetical protein